MPHKRRDTGFEMSDGATVTVGRDITSITASQDDSEVVAAVSGRRIRVLALAMVASSSLGADATSIGDRVNHVIFRSIGSATSAVTGSIAVNNHGVVPSYYTLPYNPNGWFQTAIGDALFASSLQSASAIIDLNITYAEV